MDTLFSDYTLGKLHLTSRIVMAPLTRSRALNNVPNDLMAEYYGQRAADALLITEGTSPSPNGVGYMNIPGVYNKEQVEGWKKVTSVVHAAGGKIFLQIMHVGRVAHPDNLPEGAEHLAPSAIAPPTTQMYTAGGMKDIPVPKAMTLADIKTAQAEYVTAAKNAIAAGFDGVEIHAANGYLLEQFLSPLTNQRTDEYGGSVENRLRFIVEVSEQIVAAIGAERAGMRLSPYGVLNDMGAFDSTEETFLTMAKEAKRLGLVYLHLIDHESMGAPAIPKRIEDKIREAFGGTLILSGGYTTAEQANKQIGAGRANLIAFGRAFLANPDLPTRLRENADLNEPDQDTFYTPTAEGYTDYPTLIEAVG